MGTLNQPKQSLARLITMIMPIVKDHAALRIPSEPIQEITGEVKQLAADMVETLKSTTGVGLAAPQVGVHVRMIVVACNGMAPLVMLNPVVLSGDSTGKSAQEGCLSFPGYRRDMWRYKRIKFEYTDLEGVRHNGRATNFRAFCIEHEIDHLDGKILVDVKG